MDSLGHTMLSVVTDSAFDWGNGTGNSLLMRHPHVPPGSSS
jgi:hypothetical protein